MKQLIQLKDINELARPCYADVDMVNRGITEACMLDIKPAIGDELYLRLGNDTDTAITTLLNGCEYSSSAGKKLFSGLKTAMCYYAYARVVRAGNGVQTRFGFVAKTDEHSEQQEYKKQMQAYNEAFAIADAYMVDVLAFLGEKGENYPEFKSTKVKNNRIRFKIIGK